MTHTPGPWRVETATDPFGWVNYAINGGAKPVSVEADARLIAAAPDLLAALKDMTARYITLSGSGDCGDWNPEEEDEVIASRAAIAKAEGAK